MRYYFRCHGRFLGELSIAFFTNFIEVFDLVPTSNNTESSLYAAIPLIAKMPLLAKFLSILLYLSVKSGATDLLYGSDDYDGPVFDSFLGKPSAPPVLYNTTSPTNPIPIAITCHTPVGDPNYDPKIYGPKGCQGPWNLSVVACTYEPGGVNGGPGSPAYAQVVDVLSGKRSRS